MKPILRILAGPYHRPHDDKELAGAIVTLERLKRPYALRDGNNRPATKKSGSVFIWAADTRISRGLSLDAHRTPPRLRLNPKRHPWEQVDWTKGTTEIAQMLSTDIRTVSRARRRYAPHTIGRQGKKKKAHA
ncbi:hypothetical protein [Prosthecobacter sp.]|uniref:hypothetical protein n=1 Tax=Prosthecobacter sp. TaxID=1965333 RepID=UPI003783838E